MPGNSSLHNAHLMTAHKGNICFVSRESRCLDSKYLDSKKTKQMFPEEAVIQCFVR